MRNMFRVNIMRVIDNFQFNKMPTERFTGLLK